ncbi:hypothetical protein H0H92_009338 [Tricholoma furcatifolium]|nr:hypothetical protein H0H92_009338 [Tricholoma furcatifolium]
MLQGFETIIEDGNTLSHFRAEKIVRGLTAHFQTIWIFLDGVDEEAEPKRWNEAKRVLQFLLDLTKTTPDVRLWSSSQNIGCVQDVFRDYAPISVEDGMRKDMEKFLLEKVIELHLSDESRDLFRTRFEDDLSGCFLWANMLIKDLEMARSPDDMERIIERGPSLDEYYRRFFGRIPPLDRFYARSMFALVAYARRPLRIGELQEAIAILEIIKPHHPKNNVPNLSPSRLPYTSFLKRIGAPLIVFKAEDDQTDERMEVCHLFHSTVLRFLGDHPDILEGKGDKGKLDIAPEAIADACIAYLSQVRFSCNLKKIIVHGKEEWADVEGTPISDHRFLSYAAKYWDKHRDRLTKLELTDATFSSLKSRTKDELGNVTSFLNSNNFSTCLQIQSLLVDGHFFVLTDSKQWSHRLYVYEACPPRLGMKSSATNGSVCSASARCFRILVLIDCSSHVRERLTAAGGVLLRQKTFFAGQMAGIQVSDSSEQKQTNVLRAVISVLQCLGQAHKLVKFVFPWTMYPLPFLSTDGRLNLEQYTRCEKYLSPRNDRASLVHFDDSGNCFRVGIQIYLRHARNTFYPVNIPGLKYVEEVASRGSIIAITRRRKPLKVCDLQSFSREFEDRCGNSIPRDNDGDSDDADMFGRMTDETFYKLHAFGAVRVESDSSSTAQSGDEDESSSEAPIDITSDSESSGDAYESWSECSSTRDSVSDGFEQEEFERHQSQHTFLPPTTRVGDDDSVEFDDGKYNGDEECSEDEGDGYDEDVDEDVDEDIDEGSEEDEQWDLYNEGDFNRLTVSDEENNDSEVSDDLDGDESDKSDSNDSIGVSYREFGVDIMSSDDEEAFYDGHRDRMRREKSKRTGTPKFLARLCVYNAESPQMPKEVFSFSMELQLPLHGSPPTIHPSHSLVVWPLSEGKLLFGDFETNSYFIRKLKISTSKARHIFMKCQFSTCGNFLHVAALEGISSMPKRNKPTSKSQSLAIVAYTFSLCSSQPTRTPPAFVHQARVDLGQYPEICVDDLPFTLTWTEKLLYVTERSLTLKIYRINLFEASENRGIYPVFRPDKTIVLPGTSLRRNVHFPPSNQEGCFLNEEIDLGEWVRSAGTQDVPDSHGDGRLIRPMETFDPEADCDLPFFSFVG